MMKRKYLAILLALLVPLVLTACGGNSGAISMDSALAESKGDSSNYGWAEEGEISEDAAPDSSAGGTIPANTKMIYTADMELETQDFDTASSAISQITEELGGWFENRQLTQSGSRYLFCTIRVPAENFSAFLERAGAAAHMVSRNEDKQDISETYYDSEARLATQLTKLDRLQALLAQAATMEDIIELETAISDTELEIEYLTGTLRHYDSLVSYSTVTLRLREVYRLSGEEEVPATFGQRLSAALSLGLSRGIADFEDFVIGLARNWMTLAVWLMVIAIAAAVLLRRLKRRKANAQKMVPPPPPPENKE